METKLWDSLPNQDHIYEPFRHQTTLAAGAPDPTQRAQKELGDMDGKRKHCCAKLWLVVEAVVGGLMSKDVFWGINGITSV